MPTESTTASECYEVDDRQRIYLDVEAGDGTVAHVVVRRGAERIFTGERVRTMDLGPGQALKDQQLMITANVRQIIPQATWTSLTVSVKGGLKPLLIKLQKQPDPAKDVTYVVRIDFKERKRS